MTPLMVATPYLVALRFIGLREAPGAVHTPAIVAMLDLVDRSVHDDETPWCSAFVNYVAWILGLPRSESLAARSWLGVGTPIAVSDARPGYDVVVLSRGVNAPPANVRTAPGHVGFFSSLDVATGTVRVLGGNQGDQVSLAPFPLSRVLGVRRLA